jgi:hypothetical protein
MARIGKMLEKWDELLRVIENDKLCVGRRPLQNAY